MYDRRQLEMRVLSEAAIQSACSRNAEHWQYY